MNTYSLVKTIREKVSNKELLAQLAEEAVELAHAALKFRRTHDDTNPTPVTYDEAYNNLKEEVADVLLMIDVLGLDKKYMERCMIQDEKLKRWVQRLEEKNNHGTE